MRKEIENWWQQAERDFQKAHWLFTGKHFDGTALYCQQAVEKALMTLILLTTKEKKVEGHSLVYLGKSAKIPARFLPGLKKLSPQYFISRYPDMTEEAPYELYDETVAEEYLSIATEVLKWTKRQLK
ncbi:MAG: HEPN domain-containing protein [Acidobacteria bacterium]|nr:HEPN domain-containing protein [Acidobacteriota bacterium]